MTKIYFPLLLILLFSNSFKASAETGVDAYELIYDEQETGTDPYQVRSEEHTSELQSRRLHSYAVFCLKQKT